MIILYINLINMGDTNDIIFKCGEVNGRINIDNDPEKVVEAGIDAGMFKESDKEKCISSAKQAIVYAKPEEIHGATEEDKGLLKKASTALEEEDEEEEMDGGRRRRRKTAKKMSKRKLKKWCKSKKNRRSKKGRKMCKKMSRKH